MSGYRDSYFQYHHLVDSHQVLYSEWNEDELPPPDEQGIGNNHLVNKQGSRSNGANGADQKLDASDGNSKSYNGAKSTINTYWDYFHDEDDWNLFKNVQLDSNGVATFQRPMDMRAKDMNGSLEDSDETPTFEGSNSVSGSIFNHKITRMAMVQNSNWHDLAIPKPE
ncbi:hypothetical protein HG536_0A06420 [Torulaspora globosa]|uniref:Uncharacterized protein n=1 Tax=Torulaspora globosa TaxID=48254 RepID=A0A7G3ZBE1_9SACH|nr:uncharacterized protein HG536_0A06420 [Torulaspora globosa]QLL30827.1 hypothetical protein HG536_0A06420 [Torulaspora globosa]